MIQIQLVGEPTVRERERTRGFRHVPTTTSQLYLAPVDRESLRLREQLAYRQQIALYRRVLPDLLARLDLPADTHAAWSVWLGCCSCRCSPGFRLAIPGLAIWHSIAIREVVDHTNQ